ncbi:hypothetical protein GCM10027421_00670 [Microbacterium shaanxiense]
MTLVCLLGIGAAAMLGLNWFAVVLVLVGIASLAAIDVRGLLLLAFPVYALLGALWSVALIEDGMYVTEQFRYGVNIGSTPVLAAYTLCFLAVAHAGIVRWLGRRKIVVEPNDLRKLKSLVVVGSLGVGAIYAFIFSTNGLGTSFRSRFEWIQSLTPLAGQLHGVASAYIVPVLFLLAGVFWVVKGRRDITYLLMLVPVVAILATGEKFSGMILSLSLLLTGIGLGLYLRGRRLRFRFTYLLGAMALASVLVYVLAEGYRRLGDTDIVAAINNRIVLQGHVWYGIYERFRGAPGAPATEVFGTNSLEDPAGLDYLSYLVSSADFVHRRIAAGVTFTMGGPPSILAVFGAVGGFFIFALLSLAYTLTVLGVFNALLRQAFVQAACFGALYIGVGLAVMMGRWDVVTNTVILASAGYLAVCWLLRRVAKVQARSHATSPA